ncbi:MAG: cob(I)yrinic acid a,c-diamide adenosyltransferase [Deltaproteobacteria bacterium]|nr:cob(I)yrinic acid a,c-diamide adenosyltransferase [Deltaproteobacteria bacterium]MBW1909377.1 cob(I)yrinic acid a,c-diamide adenosyltransferase [Deltaproteobacteria bacterium]MBW2035673.1 cob(I)yrinic acid a,c-diamide adenosyltransferase [Deltaproteobacteria bacterium]MBW2116099.1 cob(I)yrinic acid a,c-diamide adenosyltransferase [Deltaproteobacteria bacterium]
MLKQGLVQVYTGKTEQRNLAHIGLSLRATGQNLRTFMMCFLPHPYVDTENKALSFLKPNLVFEQLPITHTPSHGNLSPGDIATINKSFEHVQEMISNGRFDIFILEDINQVVDMGIIPANSIIDLMKKKPSNVELVLTGRNAKDEIIEQADLVTEMVEHKHEEVSWNIDGSNQDGCVGVVTGNGKGKTTYCLGRAMLFAANGIPSTVLQFIKSPQAYGEVIAIEKFPNLEIKSMGEGFILGPSEPSKIHKDAARAAWEACLREIFSLNHRLIVLDEINIATQFNLVHPDRVREMMFLKPRNLHIILSGRNAHTEMKEHASVVFEMREIKHPFNKGIPARRGIEF